MKTCSGTMSDRRKLYNTVQTLEAELQLVHIPTSDPWPDLSFVLTSLYPDWWTGASRLDILTVQTCSLTCGVNFEPYGASTGPSAGRAFRLVQWLVFRWVVCQKAPVYPSLWSLYMPQVAPSRRHAHLTLLLQCRQQLQYFPEGQGAPLRQNLHVRLGGGETVQTWRKGNVFFFFKFVQQSLVFSRSVPSVTLSFCTHAALK